MKKMIVAATAAAALLGVPALAHAEGQVYGTIGYAGIDVEGANLSAFQARFGYQFNDHFAVEAEGSIGLGDDTVSGIDVELGHELGVYGVVSAPVGEQFDVFARVGFTKASFDTSLGSLDTDGVAYGVGGQFNLTENDGIRLDWTRHNHDDAEADVWSISYSHAF